MTNRRSPVDRNKGPAGGGRWRSRQATETAPLELAGPRIRISLASADDREAIYRMRHAVYAAELGQHAARPDGRLTDALDRFNHYLVATVGERLIGFVSVTPPGFGAYSIDKYFSRGDLQFPIDDGLFEIRILTVDSAYRGGPAAAVLMYACLRWVEEHGGTRVVIIGRAEVADMYERVGLHRLGKQIQAGAVSYELMTATLQEVEQHLVRFGRLLRRFAGRIEWNLTVPFERRPGAFHGGFSHSVLGLRGRASGSRTVIAADVLDAWFPPAPTVIDVLREDPAFLAATSPPTDAVELRDTIARTLGVDAEAVLPGAGLSDLIFRCLPRWLSPGSRTLLIEPQYGEYRHVLERVVGSTVDAVVVDPGEATTAPIPPVDLAGYDLVVIVDPNNPLGYRVERSSLLGAITNAPSTLFWIDRTYAPYSTADEGHTLEHLAARSSNVVVGMSMSKAYALSGLRVGYLCGPPHMIGNAWIVSPPWLISRPAGAAAAEALASGAYYAQRYRETAGLRQELWSGLCKLEGVRPRRGVANFLFCDIDAPLNSSEMVEHAARRGLYLRAFRDDPALRWRAIRIAVKDGETQSIMLRVLGETIDEIKVAQSRLDHASWNRPALATRSRADA
jgi:histidinol-phosphate/aromatic aminotransferase/cobyric acid decarboxylase-like protein/predicted GNAT family N-acyltransferase